MGRIWLEVMEMRKKLSLLNSFWRQAKKYDVLMVYVLIFIVMLGMPFTARKLPTDMDSGEIVITIPSDKELKNTDLKVTPLTTNENMNDTVTEEIKQEVKEEIKVEKAVLKDEETIQDYTQAAEVPPVVPKQAVAKEAIKLEPAKPEPVKPKPAKPTVIKEKQVKAITPVPNGEVVVAFGWGMNPIYEDYRFNTGINIQSIQGTTVKAILPGAIIKIYETNDFGKAIEIQHDHDIITVYSCCENIKVKTGQWVNGGKEIATVAKSPISQNGYLHFEVYEKGQAIDPSEFLNSH